MTYGNGLQVKYFYDSLDRISRIQYNNGEGYVNKYRYEYDGAGRLRLMYDYETYTYTMYDYDPLGRLLKSYNYKSGKILDATSYTYDDKSRVTSMIYSLDYVYDTYVDAYEWTHTYDYDENTDLLSGMNISMSSLTASLSYTYDSLNMLSAKTSAFFDEGDASFYNRTSYEYDEARTARVYKYRSEVGVSSTGTLSATEYNFTYDSNGNITQVTNASGVIQNKYYYDNLGQLIREDNLAKNKTYVWTYDNAGNRTSEKTYAFTTGALGTATSTKNYSYSTSAWGDLMTFDGTNYITYDEIGNPTSIYQDEGSFTHGYELTWEGRQLTAYTYFEDSFKDTPTTYTYNADGIRTGKTTYSGTKYEYALDGSRIISQTWDNKIFVFVYDENGSPIGINYAPVSQDAFDYFASYYFEKNLQGDIIAIYNHNGVKIGTYTYDAWGNVTQTILSTNSTDKFIMNNNPFRYRGYYYDTDTKLYYLQTRYYNPANGRFLNADGVANLGANQDLKAYNLFVYGSNNPIMNTDPFGMFNFKNLAIAVVGVLAVTALSAATAGMGLAAMGATAAAVKVAVAAVGAVGVVAGTLEIAQQISETGDVVDPYEPIEEAAYDSAEKAIDCLCGPGDEIYKFIYNYSTACRDIYDASKEAVDNGSTWEDSVIRCSQEYLITTGVKKGIDSVLFPNATDIITKTMDLFLPKAE